MTDRSERAAELLGRLNVVEGRLDPAPDRRGQLLADVVTMVVLLVAVLVAGLTIERPILLAAMLVIGAGATRAIRHLTSYRLRKERDRLLEELGWDAGDGAET